MILLTILKSARFWAALGAVGAIVAGLVWAYNQVYEAGYNAAELKHRTLQLQAVDAAVAEARHEWEKAAKAAEREIEREVEIVERVRVVEREVPRVVVRTVSAECRDLGDDVLRLFNEAIRAGSSDEGGGAGAPADTDG